MLFLGSTLALVVSISLMKNGQRTKPGPSDHIADK
jgi:hypothetical protein